MTLKELLERSEQLRKKHGIPLIKDESIGEEYVPESLVSIHREDFETKKFFNPEWMTQFTEFDAYYAGFDFEYLTVVNKKEQ